MITWIFWHFRHSRVVDQHPLSLSPNLWGSKLQKACFLLFCCCPFYCVLCVSVLLCVCLTAAVHGSHTKARSSAQTWAIARASWCQLQWSQRALGVGELDPRRALWVVSSYVGSQPRKVHYFQILSTFQLAFFLFLFTWSAGSFKLFLTTHTLWKMRLRLLMSILPRLAATWAWHKRVREAAR